MMKKDLSADFYQNLKNNKKLTNKTMTKIYKIDGELIFDEPSLCLKEAVEKHKDKLKEADLSGADLSEANLSGADLSGS
jgi:uncharacterized protein YjbI with pentapeptide repeats